MLPGKQLDKRALCPVQKNKSEKKISQTNLCLIQPKIGRFSGEAHLDLIRFKGFCYYSCYSKSSPDLYGIDSLVWSNYLIGLTVEFHGFTKQKSAGRKGKRVNEKQIGEDVYTDWSSPILNN